MACPMLFVLAACSGGESVEKANQAITTFHQQLDAENYEGIAKTFDPELTSNKSMNDGMTNLLHLVHKKLGKITATKQINWRVNYNTSGNFTDVVMHTTFENGVADEDFGFKSDGGTLKLYGYHVNSDDLMKMMK